MLSSHSGKITAGGEQAGAHRAGGRGIQLVLSLLDDSLTGARISFCASPSLDSRSITWVVGPGGRWKGWGWLERLESQKDTAKCCRTSRLGHRTP